MNQRSSPAAVAWEELSKNVLQRFVDCHCVVFAQVVPASRTGVHICFERALETFPTDIMLALGGDWLKDNFLTADAEEHFLNFSQEFWSK